MSKYFKEKQEKKISLLEYWTQIDKEYQEIVNKIKEFSNKSYDSEKTYKRVIDLESKKSELSLQHARIKHIYTSLGNVLISKEMINTLCDTFDSSECRYGTICLKSETVKTMYDISEMFPELSKEALLSISREYIKDLFDEYSLIEKLAVMIRKEGISDLTFEKFMDKVSKFADIEDKKYNDVAWYIRIYCGQYTYDFVKHFEKFVKEHHISWQKFYESLPSPELILKDQIALKELSLKAKDCWGICDPVTFQMLESYLDGDTELSSYEEQPYYYISNYIGKTPTVFTKTEFLEDIKEKQKTLKRK